MSIRDPRPEIDAYTPARLTFRDVGGATSWSGWRRAAPGLLS
jgi:hypothetical protein